jgi:hypothetical protein
MSDGGDATRAERPATEAASFPIGDPDWPAQAADKVVELVDTVAAKTTGPAITAARAVVFGLLATILGIAALTLFSIGLVRLIDVYVPGGVWIAETIVGGAFVLCGWYLWIKRIRPAGERE